MHVINMSMESLGLHPKTRMIEGHLICVFTRYETVFYFDPRVYPSGRGLIYVIYSKYAPIIKLVH